MDTKVNTIQSAAIFITGLSASGKTTLGYKILHFLRNSKYQSLLLDGTEMLEYKILYPFKGHEPSDKIERSTHMLKLIKWFSSMKVLPVVPVIGQPIEITQYWKKELKYFVEIHLKCDLSTRIERDDKGIYNNKAVNSVAGVDYKYDEPNDVFLKINTAYTSIDQTFNQCKSSLRKLTRFTYT